MSTNKTENYQLNIWTAEDEERLGEINENFAKLDTAVAKKAEIVTGFYVGANNGSYGTRRFNLGFRPRAVILGGVAGLQSPGLLAVSPAPNGGTQWLTIDDTGFTVTYNSACYTDRAGDIYVYVTLR